jgi:glucose/arabinose dehydrogenase
MLRLAISLTCLFALQQPQAACSPSPNPPPDDSDPNVPAGPVETYSAADGTRFSVETYVRNLEVPWALAFAPDGRMFFTERPGRVRILVNNQVLPTPALTLPDAFTQSEAGALGIALHPDFASNQYVYVAYTASTGRGAFNRLVRYREVNNTLGEGAVLLDGIPAAGNHDGARLKFGPDGHLYMTMGDAGASSLAQDLGSYAGKILRVAADGTTPRDNPFASPVFSYGHRNPQGIDFNPISGVLWSTEHGPTGLDEVNLIRAGANYGWPEITGHQSRPGMESPVLLYDPSIAPSGMAFYRGARIPSFTNNMFFATLRGEHLHRVRFDDSGDRVVGEERLLEGKYGRLREVVSGPDGLLYVTTSNRDGRGSPAAADDRILRIRPAG